MLYSPYREVVRPIVEYFHTRPAELGALMASIEARSDVSAPVEVIEDDESLAGESL